MIVLQGLHVWQEFVPRQIPVSQFAVEQVRVTQIIFVIFLQDRLVSREIIVLLQVLYLDRSAIMELSHVTPQEDVLFQLAQFPQEDHALHQDV